MNLDTCTVLSLNVIKINAQSRKVNVAPRNYHSISYRLSGENTIIANGMSYKSDTGAITFVPAGLPYMHQIHTASEAIVVHFVTKESIGNQVEIIKDFPTNNAESLFCSLYHIWKTRPIENSPRCMATFYNILDGLSQKKNVVRLELERLEETVTYMYSRYRDSGFHVGELHNMALVSEAYYRRIFRRIYGCSPVYFLKQLRLNYAKELLKSGYYTVAETAELSGFTSQAYFSYTFKQMTGQTPTEFVVYSSVQAT